MTDISKIDMDRINGLIEKLESMKYVVETGSNENGWYRKWSDGFIEQFGIFVLPTSGVETLIFPIPFTNNSYSMNVSKNTSDASPWTVGISDHKIDSIKINLTGYTVYIDWYACGY